MKANSNLLVYFLANSLFLGGGLSLIVSASGKDTYIAAILGILLGVGIIYILDKINKLIDKPFKEYLKMKSFLGILIKIFYFLYLSFLILILLISLSTFLYSFFLPYTPSILSCLPLIFLATYLNSKSLKNLYYVAVALIPISIGLILIKTTLLVGEIDITNFLPIYTTGFPSIVKSSILYATISTSPYLLLLGEETNYKNSLKYYLISSVINLITIVTTTGVLGGMINIFSYPEYSVLRRIRFLEFIENIENFVSLSWILDIFITISLASLKIKDTLNTKKRIIPFIITLIIMWGIYHYVSLDYYNSIFIYKIFPYIFIGLGMVIILLILLNSQKKSNT